MTTMRDATQAIGNRSPRRPTSGEEPALTETFTFVGYDLRCRCLLCNAPIEGAVYLIPLLSANELDPDTPVCGECASAWWRRDKATLLRRRLEACAAGHHKFPGEWTKDPTDPYGDAGFWECKHGCGYVQRHPGYGIGRQIAEYEAAHPEIATS